MKDFQIDLVEGEKETQPAFDILGGHLHMG